MKWVFVPPERIKGRSKETKQTEKNWTFKKRTKPMQISVQKQKAHTHTVTQRAFSVFLPQ